MATITFRMDPHKHLVCTTSAVIYQNESNVDAVSFLLPLKYDELDIGDCIVALEYVDGTSATHVEILKKDAEIYNEQYYRYVFPITQDFTKYVGSINFVLEIVKPGEGEEADVVLRLDNACIAVSPWKDYMQYLPDDELSPMEKRVKILKELSEKDDNEVVDTDEP